MQIEININWIQWVIRITVVFEVQMDVVLSNVFEMWDGKEEGEIGGQIYLQFVEYMYKGFKNKENNVYLKFCFIEFVLSIVYQVIFQDVFKQNECY